MQHPYCYPGTDVLRNKENIRDNDELESFERMATARRLETLPRNAPISLASYREIHRYMLQDVYDWAGQYRTVDTGRTGPFCKAEYIARHMDARFAAIRAEDNLRGLASDAYNFALSGTGAGSFTIATSGATGTLSTGSSAITSSVIRATTYGCEIVCA